MSEEFSLKMDTFEVNEQAAKVQLASDPYEYLANGIDKLAMAEDEPDDIEIAIELLSEFETDLSIVASDDSLVLHSVTEAIVTYGQYSEEGLRIIYTLFKDVGFAEDVMLTAIDMKSQAASARIHNLQSEKILREVYGTE